jgi:hypothetical protein
MEKRANTQQLIAQLNASGFTKSPSENKLNQV